LLLGGRIHELVPFLSDAIIETLVIEYDERGQVLQFGSADDVEGLKTALRNAKIPYLSISPQYEDEHGDLWEGPLNSTWFQVSLDVLNKASRTHDLPSPPENA
jgi:hypothetical protein